MSILPVGEVCQVATMLLKTIRAVGESARNHKEALPRILMLEGTLKQLTQVEAREQKTLSHKKHHVEQANALEQLEIQVGKAKKIANKKGMKLKLYTLQGALFGVCDLQRIAKMMESLITSWLKLQNLPAEVRDALQKNAAGLPVFLEVEPDHGYQPLGKSEVIKDLLQNSDHKVLLIHGMTGIGKSSLARFVASEPPERFSDGALEIPFGQACSIPAANNNFGEYHSLLAAKICVLLRKLGCKKDQLEGLNLDNACQVLQEVLTGKSYLIILDDVWEVDITSRLAKLSGNSCKMLVTTRIESVHAITEADKVEIKETDVIEVARNILKYHTQLEELPVSVAQMKWN